MYIQYLVLIDQVVKYLSILFFLGNECGFSFAKIRIVQNNGFILSIGQNLDKDIVLAYTLTACVIGLIILYFFYSNTSRVMRIIVNLLAAGMISNLIDRFLYGGVIDMFWINLPILRNQIFNLSDLYISIGLIGGIIYKIIKKPKDQKRFVIREIRSAR